MHRLFAVLHMLGLTLMLFASALLLPLAVALWHGDAAREAFAYGLLTTMGVGLLIVCLTRHGRRELRTRDGFLLVALVWTILPMLACVPLMVYYAQVGQPLSFTDAYFEAMSGLTTTGSTVLTGLDSLPLSINAWRATMHWVGGMGILVLAVAVMPLLGVGGHEVMRAETPGPMKDEKLTPRIASTAKALYAVYVGLTLLCWLAYWLAGMNGFDAWFHTASTMALGGFSSHDASLGTFDSLAIELVAMVFMTVAGINFATHFSALRGDGWVAYRRCPQTPPYLLVLGLSSLLVSAYVYLEGVYDSPWAALRHGTFTTVSMATTTGFATHDHAAWPLFAPFFMLFLATFTSSAGSTGGGIKMARTIMLVKQARQELTGILHPNAVRPVTLAGRIVPPRAMASVMAYMLVFGLSTGAMTALMLLSGLDPVTALTAVLASVSNTGPGLGSVGPSGSYAVLSDFQTWVCTFAMLMGRLEFFTILVLFTTTFWRK